MAWGINGVQDGTALPEKSGGRKMGGLVPPACATGLGTNTPSYKNATCFTVHSSTLLLKTVAGERERQGVAGEEGHRHARRHEPSRRKLHGFWQLAPRTLANKRRKVTTGIEPVVAPFVVCVLPPAPAPPSIATFTPKEAPGCRRRSAAEDRTGAHRQRCTPPSTPCPESPSPCLQTSSPCSAAASCAPHPEYHPL